MGNVPQVIQMALEIDLVCQDRNHGCPVGFISLSLLENVYINVDVAHAGTGLFDLSDNL